MVISCGVVGCAKNRSNAPKEGFFRLPSLVNRVKPLNSEHLRVLKICPLLGGSLTKTVTFGTKHFCPLFKVCPLFGMSAIGRFHFTNETSQKLSGQMRDVWLSSINPKNLTLSQLLEKNSTLHVCGSYFILGRPATLLEPSKQD